MTATTEAPPAAPRRGPRVVVRGGRTHRTALAALAVAALLAAAGGAGLDPFLRGQVTLVLIYAVAISGLNLVNGYTGLISVGHSAFFGLGAYVTGVLVVRFDQDPLSTIPTAMALCFVVGLAVGIPALRLHGLYLATVTLALGIAFPEVVARLEGLTGGAAGLQIPRRLLAPPPWTGLTVGQKDLWIYWLSVVLLAVVLLAVHNLVTSRFGLAMRAVRDHEVAAAASGVDLARVKVLVFGLSGAVTGLGGCLFAMYIGSLSASGSFSLLQAIALLTGLVIGGSATRTGPLVGAFAVVFLPYWTSSIGAGQLASVLFGVVLIAIVFVMPEGIVGGLARLSRRVLVVRPAPPHPPSAPKDAP
ncbi:branched-chain amino acid ABC transporter permease [Pseudonocardia petroleophila]|uniref:Branched-chain amino acid ABC transporter permease n=1 Tax=Pseudonocardia petroleophila TaxID=37331 RepID=A0A7G7MLU0_9PSEU|nr:branched-chain amino acid ABC transporter permease [Pseudonocardia petroleophila]QNG53751.1 branched-chain amino acid ABC transporter permease [Pseudonocardia petroleophila]